jgi:hypothetical protein
LFVSFSQTLNVRVTFLNNLPDQLSSLKSLEDLRMDENDFTGVPVSVLSHLTALYAISLSFNCRRSPEEFKVSSPLQPILHPGLVLRDLRAYGGIQAPCKWDPVSLFHLGRGMRHMADRVPIPTLLFKSTDADPQALYLMCGASQSCRGRSLLTLWQDTLSACAKLCE